MNYLKRFFCMVLCVVILSLSVGSKYFDPNHIEKVEAVEEIALTGLSASVLYAICFYVGTVAYANAPIEINNLSDDQIVGMGYRTLTQIHTSGALTSIGYPVSPNDPILGFIDKAGQGYVFGANAVKAVAETSFQVIQGGKKDDNGDDDDEEGGIIDNLIKFPGNVKNLSACCSIAFGTILGTVIRDQYNNYQNGEDSIYVTDMDGHATLFTVSDISDQSSGIDYTYIWTVHNRYMYYEPWQTSHSSHSDTYIRSGTANVRVAGYLNTYSGVDSNNRNYTQYSHQVYRYDSYYGLMNFNQGGTGTFITNGEVSTTSISSSLGDSIMSYDGTQRSDIYNVTSTFTANFPIFSNMEDMKSYLVSGEGYETALNYAEPYRIADWIQDDWKGKLIDPLTGLNALSNWSNIARHQGLNALGNELDVDAFDDYLRDYFANLGTDHLPEVDPAKAPILWPASNVDGALDPETSIDPVRNPAIRPDPALKPDPGINPDPGTDPEPGVKPAPDVIDIPLEAVVPTINDSLFDVAASIKYKFPFSIPWDIQYLFTVLANTPRAPRFELPIVISSWGIDELIIVDMKRFQVLSNLSRSFFSLIFAVGLIKLTFLVVGMRKEE